MTIWDMVEAGIEFEGTVIVQQYDSKTEDLKVRKDLEEIKNNRKLWKLLTKEVKYIFPNLDFPDGKHEAPVVVIEVAEEEE